MYGLLIDGEELEIKCRSSRCGAERGILVLHRFSVSTGEYLGTKRYRAIESRKD